MKHRTSSVIINHGLLAAAMIFLIFVLGCNRSADLPEGLVAQVNDQYLIRDQVEYSVPANLDEELALSLKKRIIADWVETEVFYQAALKEGVNLNEKNQFLLENYQKELLVQQYIDQQIDRNYSISNKTIEDYYDQHRNEFIRAQDEVHIVHLLMEQRDNAIFREIRRAEKLQDIIKKYYFDEKSTQMRPNGDLGYVVLSDLPDELSRTIKRLRPGEISRAVQTDQGYHFLQLLDRQDAGTVRSLDLVKNQILLRLKRERYREELERLKKNLRKEYQIQTYLSKIQE